MASKHLMALLFLACSAAVHVMSSPAASEERFIEETDVDDPELGTLHDVREVDSRCRHEKNTNFLPDGSNTTLLDDFEDGKGVMLISNTSEVCLVRDIDQDERAQADTCKDGRVSRNKDKPDTEEKNYVKSDTELSDEEREALPEPLQAACQGKQIYKLVPKEEGDDSEGDVTGQSTTDGSLRRRKRSLRMCVKVVYRYYCYTSCSWWRCCRWCRVVKYYLLYNCPYYYYYWG